MTKEDIIKMAREAGLHIATDVHWMPVIGVEYAKRFAALVADAEREACAKVCDRYTDSCSDHEAGTAMNIQDAIRNRSIT